VQERMLFETWRDRPEHGGCHCHRWTGPHASRSVGLARDYRLSQDELQELMAEEASERPSHASSRSRELPYLQLSRGVLAAKKHLRPRQDLMRGKPLSVLCGDSRRDPQEMYERGMCEGLPPGKRG
jgi:hypothetical protein